MVGAPEARVSLDGGDWQLRACLGDEWQWHAGPDKPWDAPGWLPARVPGSVLDDLIRAGEAPSPYHERDSRLAEWAPERTWLYRRRVRIDPARPTLRFDGVDHACTVLVDGRRLAEHEGMFVPFDVDVAEFADGAERLLAVAVHAAPESEPQVGRTSRVRVHKSRMGYGWDFCPRLVHQGIWRSVSLAGQPELHPVVRLVDGVGTVEVGGEVVLRVEQPEPWWPNGLGEPRLYDAGDWRVGFRTVDFAPARGAFLVNGVLLPVKGWNWCPLDPLYGVPRPDKLERLLTLAHRAGVNVLRVWGGGLIESTDFYEACDRLGILVWQEFSQSSSGMESVPAADPDFVDLLRREARAIVPTRRRHPSLALWCGGNELAGEDGPLDDSHPALGALRDVVRELDPGRAWWATSPTGAHETHGPWEHQGLARQTALYEESTAMLLSEFGVEGMANRPALEALIEPGHRWPADRSNPVYEHLGAWWNNAPLVQESFGGRIADLETMRRASQWLQYDGLRYAVEASLRRGAGVAPWQFAESFPNAWCTAAVDWHGEPKPAYWGVARAYRDRHPSASFATWAWGGEAEVRARIHGHVAGRLVRLDGSVAAEGRDEVAAPTGELGEVFVLDLAGRNRYVMTTAETLAPLLALPQARLEVERSGSRLRVSNVGDVAALGLVLEGHARTLFEDNVLDLFPGEERTIRIEGDADAVTGAGWNGAL
ncbi:MAG TPA: glycoside hydrolase family 2 protein [Gaiellaceae bacterium]